MECVVEYVDRQSLDTVQRFKPSLHDLAVLALTQRSTRSSHTLQIRSVRIASEN